MTISRYHSNLPRTVQMPHFSSASRALFNRHERHGVKSQTADIRRPIPCGTLSDRAPRGSIGRVLFGRPHRRARKHPRAFVLRTNRLGSLFANRCRRAMHGKASPTRSRSGEHGHLRKAHCPGMDLRGRAPATDPDRKVAMTIVPTHCRAAHAQARRQQYWRRIRRANPCGVGSDRVRRLTDKFFDKTRNNRLYPHAGAQAPQHRTSALLQLPPRFPLGVVGPESQDFLQGLQK